MPIEIVQDARKKTSLSIIIRCKNELANISRLLESVEKQSFSDYEFVFIDSGSTDGTLDYLKQLPYSVFRMPPDEYNHGTSCDRGAALVDSPYLMFLSAHTYLVHDELLGEALKYMNGSPRVAGLYFRQVPNKFTGCSCLEHAFLAYRFPTGEDYDLKNNNSLSRISFSNAASIVRRSVWEKVSFGYCLGSEDRIWADKVVKLGHNITYAPHLWVAHSHEETSSMIENRVFINLMAWNNYIGSSNMADWPPFYALKKLILMIAFGPLNEWRKILSFTRTSYRGARRAWLSRPQRG